MQNEYGYVNGKELMAIYGVSESAIHNAGGIRNICKEHNLNYKYANRLDPEEIKNDFLRVYRSEGEISKEIYEKLGCYSISALKTAFGSVNNLRKELGIPIIMHKLVPKRELMEDIDRFIKESGTTSATAYRKRGKYSQVIIDRVCGGWVNALEELGYKPMNKKHGKDVMLEQITSIYGEYGFLSKPLITDNADFTYEAAAAAFGGKDGIERAIGKDGAFLKSRSSGEIILGKILGELFCSDKVETEKTYPWLRNPKTGNHLYVDFAIEDENLCIEYDGAQHFIPTEYFHTDGDGLKRSQYRDAVKEELLTQHGYKVVRFTYKEKLTTELVKQKLNIT